MLGFLENAVYEYEVGETEIAYDYLLEVEYNLKEIEDRDYMDQELLTLLNKIMNAHRKSNYENALLFTKMAIDIATLPSIEGYTCNKTGINTATKELEVHKKRSFDVENVIEHIEWDMKLRKLQGRVTKLLVEDHKVRFGKYALLA